MCVIVNLRKHTVLCRMLFVHYTATSEIDTYIHPLSLNDALAVSGFSSGHPARAKRHRHPCRCPLRGLSSPTHRRTGAPVEQRAILARTRCATAARLPRAEGQKGPGDRAQCLTLTRSEEHTSELQSLMRISYAVFCLKKKTKHKLHRQK